VGEEMINNKHLNNVVTIGEGRTRPRRHYRLTIQLWYNLTLLMLLL